MSDNSGSCCICFRNSSIVYSSMSLLYAVALITTLTVSIFNGGILLTPFEETAYGITGVTYFFASILCFMGICTGSRNYRKLWIYAAYAAIRLTLFVAAFYITSGCVILGIIFFTIAMFFSMCRDCVLHYYHHHLQPKSTKEEISTASFSEIRDDYTTPPPAYSMFQYSVLKRNDKDNQLPSYQEKIVTECKNETADAR